MKVIDRWTTQHGTWDVKASNRWGIDQAHRDKYLAGRDIPGAGGDHHIFVKAKPGTGIQFAVNRGLSGPPQQLIVPESGWVNFPMYAGGDDNNRGAVYSPDKGEKGPWSVAVYMEIVADGIGLPDGEHVSTFLVIGEGTETGTETGTGPIPPQDKIEIAVSGPSVITVNGITVWQN